ncbi:MAG: hypothetical protein IE931_09460 [Sphingobacteriales bacterium]|nr:hypothetical protein [Sphingobacteriales bacterium]
MKTLITRSSTPGMALAFLLRNQEVVFGDFFEQFPTKNSSSLAHEILKFCLDENIEQVFPSTLNELDALAEARVLFEEFGVELMISKHHKEENFQLSDAQADSFNSLSSELLALGYPNQKLAIGKADFSGNILAIEDEIKNFHQVWTRLNSVSFIQLGKLFNQQEFEALSIFKIEDHIQQNYVLVQNQEFLFFKPLPQDLIHQLKKLTEWKELNGFYELNYTSNHILRFKNIAF